MSHRPPVCQNGHNYAAWSTVERANEAGERQFVFQRTCADCGHTDEERGAIIEESERTPWRYAKVEPVGDEPDD